MEEAPPVDARTPQANEDDEDDDEQNDAEDDATPLDSPRPSRSATPRRGRGSMPRGRRRLGRPPKQEKVAVASEDETNEVPSDTGTPKKRGGFRGRGGGRWAKYKAGLTRQAQLPVDEDGNTLDVVDDEIVLPEDPEGELKVDKNGVLQDGREYRVRTFTIFGRDKKTLHVVYRAGSLSRFPRLILVLPKAQVLIQNHR